MRPPEQVLALFYDLADLDENKRLEAAVKIADAFKENGEYCMERLVRGLASARAAARVGFGTALTHVLSAYTDDWPAKTLFELADTKLDCQSTTEVPSVALGKHLLYNSMINSRSYAQVSSEIVERELAILDKHRYFAMAIAQSLAELAKQLDESAFEQNMWPKLKDRICVPVESLTPEWFFYVLLVRQSFKELLKHDVSFLSNDDASLCIDKRYYSDFINILKKADGCAESALIGELLLAARDAGSFDIVYTNVVEKWLLNGDIHKVFERCFIFVDELLSNDSLQPNEFIAILSTGFIAQIRSLRKSREYRFYASIIENILQKLENSLSSTKWKRTQLLALLSGMDTTGGGNLDEYLHGKLRITEKIISHLDAKGVETILNKALNAGGWQIRRIASVFPAWKDTLKEMVLVKLMQQESHSDEVHVTICKCIDSMFIVNVRAGRSCKAVLTDNSETILGNVLSACGAKKLKMPSSNNQALFIMAQVMNIWMLTASNQDQRSSYAKAIAEVVSIDKKLSRQNDVDGDENNKEEPLSVLIDLLLSLLSQPHRYHRTLVHFVFTSILPQLSTQNLMHIFETLSLPDHEMMIGEKEEDEEDEEEGMSVDEEDVENVVVDDGRNEEHDDTEDSEAAEESSSVSGDEDDEQKVDEQFKEKLKAALGDAAVPSDDDDDDNEDTDDDDRASVNSTVSDETMFRLDERLATVFREQLKGQRKASASTLEQIHQFRMKCFDLLLIVVSNETITIHTADFILPLLKLARELLQKKNAELLFNKATSLLEIIVKNRKSDIREKKAIKLLKKMVSVSSQIVNPVLRDLVGTVSSFLFSTAYNAEEKNVSEKMHSQIVELFSSYMQQTDNQILSELAIAPVLKYPWVFTSFLPHIIDFAFDEQIRIFRRTEALNCASTFMRKDIMKEIEADEKLSKKVAKKIASNIHTYLSTLNIEDAKPRFLASSIKLITAFASNASIERKQQLFEVLDKDLSSLCENEELWKSAAKMKHFNLASKTICGRNMLAAIKQAKSSIKVNEN